MRYSLTKSRANIDACALWCLIVRSITPGDAGRAQMARGESRAGKKGESRYSRNMKRDGELHGS